MWSSTNCTSGQRRDEFEREHHAPVLHADVEGSPCLPTRRTPSRKPGSRTEASGRARSRSAGGCRAGCGASAARRGRPRRRRPSPPAHARPCRRGARSASASSCTNAASCRCRPGSTADFGEDDLVDDDRAARRVEILQQVGAVDLRHAAQPAVAETVDVVEMDVAVDDRKVGHGVAPRGPGRPRDRQVGAEVGDARDAAQAHDAVDLAAEDVEHVRDAGLAGDREAPELRAADQAGARRRARAPSPRRRRAGCRRRAAPGCGPPTASTHAGQRVERGRRAVELAAAVVGDDQRRRRRAPTASRRLGRMQDALEDQRAFPDAGAARRRPPTTCDGSSSARHAAGERRDVRGCRPGGRSCRR